MNREKNRDSATWRRVKAIMVKEYFQMIRDPSSFLIGILLPSILILIYGFGVSLDFDHLPIGVVLEDNSPLAHNFAQALSNSATLDVKVVRDRRELYDEITNGAIRGIVVVPQQFSALWYTPGEEAVIQLITDGSEVNTANILQNYIVGAFELWKRQEALSSDRAEMRLITIEPRFWYNEQLESRNFLLPGSLAIIMTLIGTLLTALVVSREWELGTMESLMSTPVHIAEILIGKLVPYFLLGMLTMLFCVATATLFYNVPLRGSIHWLFIITSIFLLVALGLGLLISTVARNQFTAAQTALVSAFLPAYILSGFIFEISSMPIPIKMFTYLLPARYFVSALQTIFLVGDVPYLLFYNFFAISLLAVVVYSITLRVTHKRLD